MPHNDEAGNNEEDIDARESGRDPCGVVVEQHDGEHRDGAQTVDIGSITQCAAPRRARCSSPWLKPETEPMAAAQDNGSKVAFTTQAVVK